VPDLQQAIKELQETAIVTSGIQSRHAVLLKDHAEWLHAHDLAMTEARERGRELDERIAKDHAEWLREARERGRDLDERIAKLVSAIGELVRKQG
jgi:hypothetical protein